MPIISAIRNCPHDLPISAYMELILRLSELETCFDSVNCLLYFPCREPLHWVHICIIHPFWCRSITPRVDHVHRIVPAEHILIQPAAYPNRVITQPSAGNGFVPAYDPIVNFGSITNRDGCRSGGKRRDGGLGSRSSSCGNGFHGAKCRRFRDGCHGDWEWFKEQDGCRAVRNRRCLW